MLRLKLIPVSNPGPWYKINSAVPCQSNIFFPKRLVSTIGNWRGPARARYECSLWIVHEFNVVTARVYVMSRNIWPCNIQGITMVKYSMRPVSLLFHNSWLRHQWPVDSPHKGQWHISLMFSLICAWRNGCANNRDDGDLIRHRAHCDVTVMYLWICSWI